MNKHLTLLLFFGLVWGQKEYMTTNLVKQNGVFKKKFSDEISNGAVFKMISGNKVRLGNMKDGKPNGKGKNEKGDGKGKPPKGKGKHEREQSRERSQQQVPQPVAPLETVYKNDNHNNNKNNNNTS